MSDEEGALTTFIRSLQQLRLTAGNPPIVAIATLASVSPSAVSTTLTGKKHPTWPVVQGIVKALGGNVEDFREAWGAIQLSRLPTSSRYRPALNRREARAHALDAASRLATPGTSVTEVLLMATTFTAWICGEDVIPEVSNDDQ